MNSLSFDLKNAMRLLCKDNRWNVLTVLMLHSNVRNRCWPSMDIITAMGSNGNRAKAVRAKKWLIKHKALELVPTKQRHPDETHLPPRQHIYQLTGIIQACNDPECDCKADGKTYAYYNVQDLKSFNGETIKSSTVEIIDGETLSSPIESNPIKDSTPSSDDVIPSTSNDDKPDTAKQENDAINALIEVWIDEQKVIDKKAYGKTGYRSVAKQLYQEGITPEDVRKFIQYRKQDAFWQDKLVVWGHIQGNIATWKAKQIAPVAPPPRPAGEPASVFDLMG